MLDTPTTRKPQPKCDRDHCRHPVSFHRGGNGKCRALGCKCQAWVKTSINSFIITVDGQAKRLGRGKTWVKEHAEQLGGRKINGRWMFPGPLSEESNGTSSGQAQEGSHQEEVRPQEASRT